MTKLFIVISIAGTRIFGFLFLRRIMFYPENAILSITVPTAS